MRTISRCNGRGGVGWLVEAARDNIRDCPGIFVKIGLETWRGVLAFIETISAKVRLFRAPEFLGTAFLLAVLGMLIHFMLEV